MLLTRKAGHLEKLTLMILSGCFLNIKVHKVSKMLGRCIREKSKECKVNNDKTTRRNECQRIIISSYFYIQRTNAQSNLLKLIFYNTSSSIEENIMLKEKPAETHLNSEYTEV